MQAVKGTVASGYEQAYDPEPEVSEIPQEWFRPSEEDKLL